MADEDVVIARRDIIMRGEPFVFEEGAFPVRKVSSDAHIWHVGEKVNSGNYDAVIGVHAFLSLHLSSVRKHLNVRSVIAWMHNSYNALFEKENPYLPGLKSFFANEMRRLDGIVVLSKSDERLFRKNLGLESVTIYNPLTLEPRGRASLRYKKFLAIGRFSPKHKGFDFM